MTAKTSWIIEYRAGLYRFGRLGVDAQLHDAPAGDPAEPDALVQALAEAGYSGQAAMLTIPSPWCLPASLEVASRRLARNPQALAYALEERLPLSAEDVVCDFVVRDTIAFGVAAETSFLEPIVRSLEKAGITIITITPTAVLLIEHLVHSLHVPDDGLVVFVGDGGCDLFLLHASRPHKWRHLPVDTRLVVREIAEILLERQDEAVLPVMIVARAGEFELSLGPLQEDIELVRYEMDSDQALLGAATNVLSGRMRPWIEFRRDPIGPYDPYRLMRGSIRALLLSLLVALLCLAAAAWIQGSKYQALLSSIDSQKNVLFRELFPGSRMPTGIQTRLESEHRKLQGMSATDTGTPEVVAVTDFLVDTLSALPSDLRFRLVELRFEQRHAQLEGEVRRHGDVDVIASALRGRGLLVAPPRTEQLADQGVGFSLSVTLPEPSSGNE